MDGSNRRPARLLHVSDLHLNHSHAAEAIGLVEGMARLAVNVRAEALLVAGDVFDSSNQPDDFVDAVAEAMHALEVPLVAIPGNHDIRYTERDGDAFDRLAAQAATNHHYLLDASGRTVEALEGHLRVWGRGMPEHTPRNNPLAELPLFEADHCWSVVLAHGELDADDGSRSSPILLDRHAEELARVDYVALGHRHEPLVRQGAGTVVSYSGSASTVIGGGDVAIVDLHPARGVTVTPRRLRV